MCSRTGGYEQVELLRVRLAADGAHADTGVGLREYDLASFESFPVIKPGFTFF